MKTTVISIAAAMLVAGPALAERENHVYRGEVSGDYATAIVAAAHFAMDDQGDGAGRVIVSTSNASVAVEAKVKLANDERGFN